MLQYIRAICSILVFIVLIASVILFAFGYGDNKKDSKECAYFFEDFSNQNNELFYKKVDDKCCHFTLIDDKIVEECVKYE